MNYSTHCTVFSYLNSLCVVFSLLNYTWLLDRYEIIKVVVFRVDVVVTI